MEKSVNVKELRDQFPAEFEREYAKWQQYCLDHEWWDGTYEFWIEKLKGLGITTYAEDIQFSGFCSQGDGASFTGYVHLQQFWEAHGAPPEYLPLIELDRNGLVGSVALERSGGRYSHEHTVRLRSSEIDSFPGDTIGRGLFAGQDAMDFIYEVIDPMLAEVENWIEDICRGYMRELYDDLEKEYEYLISEERFVESCECNDVTFEVEVEEEEVA